MDRALKAFLTIADVGNVTAAADRMALAQPSLTKMLARLERELGVRLFDRLPRGMALTDYGERLYQRARTIEQEYRFAREEMAALKNGHRQALRVGAGPLYHLVHAPRVLEVMLEEFPETQLELVADVNAKTIPMLERGELDIVLGAVDTPDRPRGVETLQLTESDYGVIVRPDHPLKQKRVLAPADLLGWTWIVYQQDEVVEERLRIFFRRHQLEPPSIALRTSSFAAGLQLVSGSDYVMAAPTQLAPAIRNAGLTILRTKQSMWRFPSGIWYRTSSLGYPIIQRFIEVTKATVPA